MSILAVEASIDSQSALVETILVVLISLSVQTSAVPVPDGSLEGILGESSISGVVNEVVTDSLTSIDVVVSASDLDGASSLESLSVTRLGVAQILSSFISGTGGDFFHIVEGAGFFSDLAEESGDSGASGDATPSHSFVKVGEVSFEVASVAGGHDGGELVDVKAHGGSNGENEGEEKESGFHGNLINKFGIIKEESEMGIYRVRRVFVIKDFGGSKS